MQRALIPWNKKKKNAGVISGWKKGHEQTKEKVFFLYGCGYEFDRQEMIVTVKTVAKLISMINIGE